MLGGDDRNSFIGVFAAIEIAGIDSLLNACGDGSVFLGFTGIDVLAKADLIALGPKRLD